MTENSSDDAFFEQLAETAHDEPFETAPGSLKTRLLSELLAWQEDPQSRFFERLPAGVESLRAPSRLKSRIYSALIQKQRESGPLLSLSECGSLCVFEKLIRIVPVGQRAKSFHCCSVCHARLMAERIETAPIYWPGCPYVGFQNR